MFGVGNVVTGQGNIRVSLIHSQQVTSHLIENYMGIGDGGNSDLSGIHAAAEASASAHAQAVRQQLQSLPVFSKKQAEELRQRIRGLQERVGYTDYDSWIAQETPADLE